MTEPSTPLMRQYATVKKEHPTALLFFRLGDFYELFFDDAVKAAAALGITLTQRGKHAGQDIPMAGVPVHAAEAYLAKLIRAGPARLQYDRAVRDAPSIVQTIPLNSVQKK